LNALRDDIEENSQKHAEAQLKAMENMKVDFEKELASLRTEMIATLQDLAEDVKEMKTNQDEGGVTISGKRVAGAVKAVKEIRSSLFKSSKKD
jgi:recombinational DNA repair ATPase RecF